MIELILEAQEVEAPCQEEQEGAWASEAYLDACCQEGKAVVRVEVHHHPVGLVSLHLEAWPYWGALLEASTQEEEQEGKRQEVAGQAWASQLPVWSGLAAEQSVVAEHLRTAGAACLPGKEGFGRPGVALRPSRDVLLWNPS